MKGLGELEYYTNLTSKVMETSIRIVNATLDISSFYDYIERTVERILKQELVNSGNDGRRHQVEGGYDPYTGTESFWLDDVLMLKVQWSSNGVEIL